MLSGVFVATVVQGEVRRVQDLERADLAWSLAPPDMSQWSEGRIRAWEEARQAGVTDMLAVLDIPDLGLKVPIYGSASDLDMDRGYDWQGLAEGITARLAPARWEISVLPGTATVTSARSRTRKSATPCGCARRKDSSAM